MTGARSSIGANVLPGAAFEVINGVEMVPGTVHLLDLERRMSVKHQDNGNSDVVLIPQPTNDPNDPLNWSRARKEYHFWSLFLWGFIAAASVNWGGPVWTQLTIDFNTDFFQLNVSSALCFIALGLGCVFLQPTAMKIGRRPVYMFGTLLNLVGCIWGGLVTSVQGYFGVSFITGFGAAPVDSLVEISAVDIFFVHERGTRLSLFVFTLYAGSYLGPVASGYIATSQSWRWCFWYLVIFFGILLVVQLISLEESNFRRPDNVSTISEGDVDINATNKSTMTAADTEKKTAAPDVKVSPQSPNSASRSEESSLSSPPKKTFVQRMALFDLTQNDRRSWLVICLRPFSLVIYPAIVWGGFVYGVQIMWLSLLYSTQSLIFAAPPYNFSIANVGNTNLAAFIGSILGMLWGGPVSDWWTQRMARGNKGIMEPEFRLWTMMFPAFINTAGLFMYGVGAAQGDSWVLSAGFGIGFIAFGIGSGGAIAITYAVDAYPAVASEGLVLMLFIRNMIGAGFTFAIQPWLDHNGLQTTSIIMAVLCLVVNMSFLGFTWKGKAIRRWTATSYLTFANEGGGHGGHV